MNRILEIFIHIYRFLIHKYFYGYNNFGNSVAIDKNVKINNAQYISVGNNVHLQDNVWLNVVLNKTSTPTIKIGNNSDIGRGAFISAIQQIKIGNSVLFAPNVHISDHSHSYEDITTPILEQKVSNIKPVEIQDGAWIGINSVILPGVIIGKNSVVGANSIVRESVADYTVVAGSPAKIIKRYNLKSDRWEKV